MYHPEHVGGRRLWMDSVMTDLIDKLHHGDPIRGWEGDERLAVYWNEPRWEIWRLEEDDQYRMICRSQPGVPFDERLIDQLCAWDVRRRTVSLADEVEANNAAVDAAKKAERDDYMNHEVVPRLEHALIKEAGW